MQPLTTTTTEKKEIDPRNAKLIDKLYAQGTIKSYEVEKVMKSIDRGDFTSYGAYDDRYNFTSESLNSITRYCLIC